MSCILVADDELHIVSTLSLFLEQDGFRVLSASDGRAALRIARVENPDLLILDWNLPDLDGLSVCSQLRQTGADLPIMLLTGRDAEFDKVLAFNAGADDYMTKPFSLAELAVRCRALLRRARPGTAVMSVGDLVVDQLGRQASLSGEILNLTPKEFSLLAFLAANIGRPVSRELLLHKVWGYEFYGNTRTVDVHVSRLRSKLRDDEANPRRILTVKSVGYTLVPMDGLRVADA